MDAETTLREAYWAAPPQLPEGVGLERHEPIAVTRSGRGGVSVYDVVELATPTARVPLLVGYRTRLLAKHIDKLRERLGSLARQRRDRRIAAGGRPAPELVPAIVTDVAKPTVIDACRRAGVAILDQRGTVIVSARDVFVFVQGRGSVQRAWRGRLFSGKASRVVRFLLAHVAFEPVVAPRTARDIASRCDLSYAYAHGVLRKLEDEGFVERSSSHAGFRLKDPIGLLRAWISSGERTAVAVEGFHAPATSREALIEAAKKLEDETGDEALFSLASALQPDEIHVAGLPHGAYWPGELAPLVEAFRLRRTTPHNFLVLRPDPLAWTAAGGLLLVERTRREHSDPRIRRVALPQLAADFAALPGRGREQAEFLVGVYSERLPYRLDAA